MKYLITDRNIKWDREYKNIEKITVLNRNNYVTNNLHNNWQEELEQQPEKATLDTIDNLTGTIEVKWNGTTEELREKNTIIIKENIKSQQYSFWWIDDVENLGNNNMYNLSITKNVILTYPNVVDSMKNILLAEGHAPIETYFNYEFNGGDRIVSNVKPLLPFAKPDGLGANGGLHKSSLWAVVFRKLQYTEDKGIPVWPLDNEVGMENGVLLKSKIKLPFGDYFDTTLVAPYKIFLAPVVYRGENGVKVWNNYSDGKPTDATFAEANIERLFKTYQQDRNDGLTYAFKIINHEFDTSYNVLTKSVDDGVLELKEYNTRNIPTHNMPGGNLQNTYIVSIPSDVKTILELLDGLNKYSLNIEGVKDFNMPLKYVFYDENTLEFKLVFSHTIGLSPSEPRESIFFKGTKGYSTLQEEYTWNNLTELTTYTNQLDEYDANNPRNLIGRGLQTIKGAFVGGAAGAGVGALAGGVGALPGAIGGAIFGGVSSIAGNQFNRGNMKRSPEEIQEDGSSYHFLMNTETPYSFTLRENTYVGLERESAIGALYRNGIALEKPILIRDIESIERPKFTFIRTANFVETIYSLDLPASVIDEYINIFDGRGTRIWNSGWLDWAEDWSDNGDSLVDAIEPGDTYDPEESYPEDPTNGQSEDSANSKPTDPGATGNNDFQLGGYWQNGSSWNPDIGWNPSPDLPDTGTDPGNPGSGGGGNFVLPGNITVTTRQVKVSDPSTEGALGSDFIETTQQDINRNKVNALFEFTRDGEEDE